MKKVFRLTKGKHINTDEWQLNGEGLLCDEGLREFFDIPKDATKLYVTISDKPSSESYKVEADIYWDIVDGVKLSIPNKPDKVWDVWTYMKLDKFLDDSGLYNFYVSVHYE